MAQLLAGLDRVLAGLPREPQHQEPSDKQYDALFWAHPNDQETGPNTDRMAGGELAIKNRSA